MSAMLYRLHPEDFEARTRFGRPAGSTLADWPLRYADLKPYYDTVAAFVGVSGAPGDNPFEPPSDMATLPPLATHPAAEAVDRAARSVGLHPYPTPRGILSARRPSEEHRGPCVACGYCGSYGCPVGAKASSADTFLHEVEAGGRCRVAAGTMVAEILVDDGDRVTGVVALDDEGGRHRISAPRVLLGASAVETPRLLLMSRPKRHPEGLGDASGQVGRNLVVGIETAGRAVFGYPSDRFRPADDAHPFLNRSVQDRYLDPGAPGPYPKVGTLVLDRPHLNPIARAARAARGGRAAPALGRELVARLRRHFLEEREILYESFVEMLPRPGARVRLDPEVVDRHGLPVARIEVDDVPDEARRAARLTELARGVLSALGPERIEEDAPLRRTYFLQAGTCRMGTDPEASVCDALGRVRSIAGLHIVDGSALPTMGGVPPTLTIMANALRIADAIAEGAR
jgi:choline dehydrogenase-like flavoprotein